MRLITQYLRYWILISVAAAGLWFLATLVFAPSDTTGQSLGIDCKQVVSSLNLTGQQMTNATAQTQFSGLTGDAKFLAVRKGVDLSNSKYEQALRLVVNNPTCFSPGDLAQAQTALRQFMQR